MTVSTACAIDRVALRFDDERSVPIERMRLHQRGGDDERGDERLEPRPEQPDSGAGERGAGGDERHVVADPERMSLQYARAADAAAATGARNSASGARERERTNAITISVSPA